MTERQVLRIPYVSKDLTVGQSPWVRLEQIMPPAISQFASLRDVYLLWMAASTGTSARTLRATGCPVEFVGSEIHVYLGFYAWPSDPALPFDFASALPTSSIGERQAVRKQRQMSLLINNANRCELEYYLEEVDIEWETPCYDRYGAEIEHPEVTIHSTWIDFSTEIFAVIRVTGMAIGETAVCEMVLDRPMTEEAISEAEQDEIKRKNLEADILAPVPKSRLNGYKVENLENTITVTWQDLDGSTRTDQLRLEIPLCVQEVLKFCPDMFKTILILCLKTSTLQVYYNACKWDHVIAAIEGANPQRWCTRIDKGIEGPWRG